MRVTFFSVYVYGYEVYSFHSEVCDLGCRCALQNVGGFISVVLRPGEGVFECITLSSIHACSL